ncbi:MAG: hypothetical protein R3A47_06420 [Polyangiales bacterium]
MNGELDMDVYGSLSLAELVMQHGTKPECDGWVRAFKKLKEAEFLDLQYERRRNQMIDRELVKRHVFALIDDIEHRLICNAPKAITKMLLSRVATGAATHGCEEAVCAVISAELKGAKAAAAHRFRRENMDQRRSQTTPT